MHRVATAILPLRSRPYRIPFSKLSSLVMPSTAAAPTSLPLSYRALLVPQLKAPLELSQRTVTSLSADELLVRVAYAAINPMDPKLAAFNFVRQPLPLCLGYNFSGTVVAVGADSQQAEPVEGGELAVGDTVFGWSYPQGGCYAEYVTVRRQQAVKTAALPLQEASSYGVAYLTAWEGVMVTGRVDQLEGQWVYITGGAGGVGHFAVQLAKAYGAKVITSGGKPDSLKLISRLGVDGVVDYRQQDVVQEVLRITDGAGVALAFDSTYQPASFVQCAGVLARGGVFVKLGEWSRTAGAGEEAVSTAEQRGGRLVVSDLGRWFVNPDWMGRQSELVEGLRRAPELHASGKVRAHVSKVVPFEAGAVQQALDDIAAGKGSVAKTVIAIGE